MARKQEASCFPLFNFFFCVLDSPAVSCFYHSCIMPCRRAAADLRSGGRTVAKSVFT